MVSVADHINYRRLWSTSARAPPTARLPLCSITPRLCLPSFARSFLANASSRMLEAKSLRTPARPTSRSCAVQPILPRLPRVAMMVMMAMIVPAPLLPAAPLMRLTRTRAPLPLLRLTTLPPLPWHLWALVLSPLPQLAFSPTCSSC